MQGWLHDDLYRLQLFSYLICSYFIFSSRSLSLSLSFFFTNSYLLNCFTPFICRLMLLIRKKTKSKQQTPIIKPDALYPFNQLNCSIKRVWSIIMFCSFVVILYLIIIPDITKVE